MPSLKEVKNRISSVISTQQITRAMKMVAAAKLRRSQDRILQFRPYAQRISLLLQNLSATYDKEGSDNWFSKECPERSILIVPINSDRGLCGSFNSNVHRAVVRLIEEKYGDQRGKGMITILPLGKRAFEYFSKRKYKTVADHWQIFRELNFQHVATVADRIMDEFRRGNYDKIELVFNEFRNVATQILRIEQFLPILPVQKEVKAPPVDHIFQPDQQTIMRDIIPRTLRSQLYKAVLDSSAAENGARMTAMGKATDNAGELLKDLRLSYNRTRQAVITKEILEIVGGAEALRAM